MARIADIGELALLRLASAVAVVASFVWDSLVDMSGAPVCPSHRLLGIECPACGLSRAFVAIGNGLPGMATQHNLAAPLLWVGMAAVVVHWAAELGGGRWRPAWLGLVAQSWLAAVVVLLVLGWILRLVPAGVAA